MKHKDHNKKQDDAPETLPAQPPASIPDPAAAETVPAAVPVEASAPAQGPVLPSDDRIQKLEEEKKAMADRLLRLQADFENFRKRTLRERGELSTMANEDIFRSLLPVLDNAYLSIQSAADHVDAASPVFSGFRLVIDELMAVLARQGLQVLEPVEGPFDPQYHEAISALPSDTVPENHILQLFRRGYQLKDRLLRAAQVIVSSGPSAADDTVPVAPPVCDSQDATPKEP